MLKNYVTFVIFFLMVSVSFSQKLEEGQVIRLYPNPAESFFSVETHNVKVLKVEIFSLLGIKEREITGLYRNIDISNLPKGIYMVKVYSKKGYVVKKLIINASG